MLETVIFAALALLAVAAGVAVFRTDSMARASYALATSFVAVGIMLLQLRLEYIGIITVLMMVMEMAIMAIFMIMFMGMNPALMPMDMVHSKKVAASAAVGLFLLLAAGILLADWPQARTQPAGNLTASLGEAIMGSKMLVMLVVSPVLFATLVSALVLANPRGRYAAYPAVPPEPKEDDSDAHHGRRGSHEDDGGQDDNSGHEGHHAGHEKRTGHEGHHGSGGHR